MSIGHSSQIATCRINRGAHRDASGWIFELGLRPEGNQAGDRWKGSAGQYSLSAG